MPDKTAIGLDISDWSAKAVVIAEVDGRRKITASSKVSLPENSVADGKINDRPALEGAVKVLFSDFDDCGKNSDLAISLSSGLIFFGSSDSGNAPDQDQEQKKYSSEWSDFFAAAGYAVRRVERGANARMRALSLREEGMPACAIDLGRSVISIEIFHAPQAPYCHYLHYGGEYISQKLSKSLKISRAEAEEAKKTIVLAGQAEKDEGRFTLKTVFIHIMEEIKKAEKAFAAGCPGSGPLKKIHLFGGTSRIRGLADFFRYAGIETPVLPAEPHPDFAGLDHDYLVACGAAMSFWDSPISGGPRHATDSIGPKSPDAAPRRRRYGIAAAILSAALLAGGWHYFSAREPRDSEQKGSGAEAPAQVIDNIDNGKSQVSILEMPKNKARVKAIGGGLNVRSSPSLSGDIISRISPGQEFPIMSETADWLEIDLGAGKSGWASKEYLETVGF